MQFLLELFFRETTDACLFTRDEVVRAPFAFKSIPSIEAVETSLGYEILAA